MKFSLALYGESGTDMNYQYTLTPQQTDQVEEFEMHGQRQHFEVEGRLAARLRMAGFRHEEFSPFAEAGRRSSGRDGKSTTGRGLCSSFFNYANGNIGTSFSWSPTTGRDQQPLISLGRPLTYDLSVSADGPVIFSKEFLSKLKCVVPVAR